LAPRVCRFEPSLAALFRTEEVDFSTYWTNRRTRKRCWGRAA
jgi:hypothetical protein